MKFNPHVHVLVSEGGLDEDGRWRRVNWFPYKLLRKKWQYLLLTAICEPVGQQAEEARLISHLFDEYKDGFYTPRGEE